MSDIPRSNSSIPSPRLDEQLLARLADVHVAGAMKAFMKAFTGEGSTTAPRTNPPISGGMTDVMERLKRIIMARRVLSPEEYCQVPDLLRRMRHLLRVFYNAKTSGKRTSEFAYCDYEDIDDMGVDLHRLGLALQLTPGRLRELFEYAPEMDKFLIDEPIDIGELRKRSFERERAVHADPESTDDDRFAAGDLEDKAMEDLAAYHMVFFMADLFVGWLLIPPRDETERRRQERVLERYVEYASGPVYRYNDAFGDALTTASRPLYSSTELSLRFAKAGGLPGMFDDWAVSVAKDGYVNSCLERLPSSAWENQSDAALVGIMRGLLKRLEHDNNDVLKPVFVNTIYEINSHYGYDVFQKGFTISHHEILFHFLHRRIGRHPESYGSKRAIKALLKRYLHIPRTTSRRYLWTVLPISGRWDCLGFYGCANPECPEQKVLQELRAKRRRGNRDTVVEERLFRWGALSKACTSCKTVSYCSVECQKAHWSAHKPICKKKTPKDQTEVELEI